MLRDLPEHALQSIPDFCRKWQIEELALFGSALREDFGPGSDIDLFVRFKPDVVWGIDEWLEMRDTLEELFGRRVDLVSDNSLRNPFRRAEILRTRHVLHAA